MNVVDRGAIRLSHCPHLTGNACRLDHEKADRGGTPDIGFDVAHKRVLDPDAAISPVQPLARALQCRALFLDMGQLRADEIPRLNDVRIIALEKSFGKRRFAGADRPRQHRNAKCVLRKVQMKSFCVCPLGGKS